MDSDHALVIVSASTARQHEPVVITFESFYYLTNRHHCSCHE